MNDNIVKIQGRSWFTVKLEGLLLPTFCVGCGGNATDRVTVKGQRLDWLTSLFTLGLIYSAQNIFLSFLICRGCPHLMRRKGMIWGAILGSLTGAIAAWIVFTYKVPSYSSSPFSFQLLRSWVPDTV
jgi:hypothetical protein